MTKSFTNAMFEKLKEEMKKNEGSGSFKDMLKFEIGKSYLVRLIPNLGEIEKTFFHYYFHGINSLATGQFMGFLCPTTYGERCPLCEHVMKLYREDNEESKKLATSLKRTEQWLVNTYVIKDPTKEENNGQIKIMRYGRQLNKIIRDAIDGIDAEEFGEKIFDLTEKGCTLRVTVEKNEGGYASYTSSKFLSPGTNPIPKEVDTDDFQNNLFELEKSSSYDSMSLEEIKELVDEHVLGEVASESIRKPDEFKVEDLEEELPGLEKKDEGEDVFDEGDSESEPAEEKKEEKAEPEKKETQSKEETKKEESKDDSKKESSLDDELSELLKDID